MKKLLMACSLMILCTQPLFADEVSHQKLAQELLNVMHMEGQMNQMMENIKKSQAAMFAQSNAPVNNDLMKQMDALIQSELGYKNLEKDFVQVYSAIYSEEELRGIINFYN